MKAGRYSRHRTPIKGIYIWQNDSGKKSSKNKKNRHKKHSKRKESKVYGAKHKKLPEASDKKLNELRVIFRDSQTLEEWRDKVVERNQKIAKQYQAPKQRIIETHWTKKKFETSFEKSVHYENLKKQKADNSAFGGTGKRSVSTYRPDMEWQKMITEQRKNSESGINNFEK